MDHHRPSSSSGPTPPGMNMGYAPPPSGHVIHASPHSSSSNQQHPSHPAAYPHHLSPSSNGGSGGGTISFSIPQQQQHSRDALPPMHTLLDHAPHPSHPPSPPATHSHGAGGHGHGHIAPLHQQQQHPMHQQQQHAHPHAPHVQTMQQHYHHAPPPSTVAPLHHQQQPSQAPAARPTTGSGSAAQRTASRPISSHRRSPSPSFQTYTASPSSTSKPPVPRTNGLVAPSSATNNSKPMQLIYKYKPTSRVSRACNACRRQKMRCDGTKPCRRCIKNGNEDGCVFEKPTRPTSSFGAGSSSLASEMNNTGGMEEGITTGQEEDGAGEAVKQGGSSSILSRLRATTDPGQGVSRNDHENESGTRSGEAPVTKTQGPEYQTLVERFADVFAASIRNATDRNGGGGHAAAREGSRRESAQRRKEDGMQQVDESDHAEAAAAGRASGDDASQQQQRRESGQVKRSASGDHDGHDRRHDEEEAEEDEEDREGEDDDEEDEGSTAQLAREAASTLTDFLITTAHHRPFSSSYAADGEQRQLLDAQRAHFDTRLNGMQHELQACREMLAAMTGQLEVLLRRTATGGNAAAMEASGSEQLQRGGATSGTRETSSTSIVNAGMDRARSISEIQANAAAAAAAAASVAASRDTRPVRSDSLDSAATRPGTSVPRIPIARAASLGGPTTNAASDAANGGNAANGLSPSLAAAASSAPGAARRGTRSPAEDLANEELNAPISALRGLADAAAAVAVGAATRTPNEKAGVVASVSAGSLYHGSPSALSASAAEATPKDLDNEGGKGQEIAAGRNGKRRADSSVSESASIAKRHRRTTGGSDMPVSEAAAAAATPKTVGHVNNSITADPTDDQNVVDLGLISEEEARFLFALFARVVPTFISIFAFESLPPDEACGKWYDTVRARSVLLFDAIVAIALLIHSGPPPWPPLYHSCLTEAYRHAKQTLLSPGASMESIQAVILLSAYADNGWLMSGHATRMSQESGLDRAFARLTKSVERDGKNLQEQMDLAQQARIWFFLFLSDHQISFGAGRPPMLSFLYVRNCRAFLDLPSPLSIPIDARLISTLELLVIRERYHDVLAPYDAPIDRRMASNMLAVTGELSEWQQHWSEVMLGKGYSETSFVMSSLRLQRATQELYFLCTALRGVKSVADMNNVPTIQAGMIRDAASAAQEVLRIANGSQVYRDNLAHAPSYTYVTSTFAAVFLIKVARLSEDDIVNTRDVFESAEKLASRLSEVPAAKYAHLIRLLLQACWKDIARRNPQQGLQAVFGSDENVPAPEVLTTSTSVSGMDQDGKALLQQLLTHHQRTGTSRPTTSAGNKSGHHSGGFDAVHDAAISWAAETPSGGQENPFLSEEGLPSWLTEEVPFAGDMTNLWGAFDESMLTASGGSLAQSGFNGQSPQVMSGAQPQENALQYAADAMQMQMLQGQQPVGGQAGFVIPPSNQAFSYSTAIGGPGTLQTIMNQLL